MKSLNGFLENHIKDFQAVECVFAKWEKFVMKERDNECKTIFLIFNHNHFSQTYVNVLMYLHSIHTQNFFGNLRGFLSIIYCIN